MNSYVTEEIGISVDGIKISGTLTLPKKENNPCVILISGYGPKTRDSPVKGFNRYEFLAEQLAKNGIASFRYDDRGCGKSSEVNWHDYTFDDLANEVIKIHSVLIKHHLTSPNNHPTVNPNKIGLFGHSLGATIAPMAASKNNDILFVVSSAPHGLVGIETAIQTRNAFAKHAGESPEETTAHEEFLKTVLIDLREEKTSDDTFSVLKQVMLKQYNKTIEKDKREKITFEIFLQSTYEGFLIALGNTPMYRSFLKFNPQDMYSKLSCPILLLFAENDLYHPPIVHKEVILTSLMKSNENITIHDFSNANHDFIMQENQNVIGFIDNFTEILIEWISNQFNK